VAVDVSLTQRNPTGTGTYANELLNALRELPVDVVALPGWQILGRQPGPARRAAQFLTNVLWTEVGLPVQARRESVDVIHAPAFVAPLVAPCPTVVTVLDSSIARFPSHYSLRWRTYVEWSLARTIPRAAAILTISEDAKRDIVEAYRVPESRVHVSFLGVDSNRFRPLASRNDDMFRLRFGFSPGYVLHVGALVTRKNIPTLVRAVALMHERNEWRPTLVLAGGAAKGMGGADEIRRAVAQCRLEDHVIQLNHVSAEDLIVLYQHAAVLAMPSMYEGFGLPVIEAMACGTPVVASDNSALREIVAGDGLLVPTSDAEGFADALTKSGPESEFRTTLVKRGFARAAKFTWANTARQTLRAYAHACGREDQIVGAGDPACV
jgi:glycosyltransferase involved in cell wall biosynthesis